MMTKAETVMKKIKKTTNGQISLRETIGEPDSTSLSRVKCVSLGYPFKHPCSEGVCMGYSSSSVELFML